MEEDTDNTINLSLSYPIFAPYVELGKYVGTTTNFGMIFHVLSKVTHFFKNIPLSTPCCEQQLNKFSFIWLVDVIGIVIEKTCQEQ